MPYLQPTVIAVDEILDFMANAIHSANIKKGFYEGRDPERVNDLLSMHMLIVTEVAEMSEAVRERGPKMSEKIPEFSNEEEEAADILIRLLDYSAFRKLQLSAAVGAKLAYNETRAHKHGKRT